MAVLTMAPVLRGLRRGNAGPLFPRRCNGMRIIVLGAGVVGTAAAYYLARDGHEVTVVERHDAAALGTSYSNAGLVSPGDATAWASPAALKTFLQSLYKPDLGIKVRLRF